MPESKPKHRAAGDEVVDESSDESFPASDPPSWAMGKRTEPSPSRGRDEPPGGRRSAEQARARTVEASRRAPGAEPPFLDVRAPVHSVHCRGNNDRPRIRRPRPRARGAASTSTSPATTSCCRGNFSDWESGLAFGPDLDRVRREAGDRRDQHPGRGRRPRQACSRFTAARSKSLGDGRYRVVGTFTGPRGAKALEMNDREPTRSHGADRRHLRGEEAGLRRRLARPDRQRRSVREAGTGDAEGPVRSAHAWLLPPPLARSLSAAVSRLEPSIIGAK